MASSAAERKKIKVINKPRQKSASAKHRKQATCGHSSSDV